MRLNEINNTKICAQLWTNASIEVSGNSAICCNMFFKESQNINIRNSSPDSFLTTEKLKSLRHQMINGIEPSECGPCFAKERQNIHSIRQYKNAQYFANNESFDVTKVELQNLELQLGNLCQLQCLICSPQRSIKINDFFNFNNKRLGHNQYKFDEYTWYKDDKIINDIALSCAEVKEIFINGGEPLLVAAHNMFLTKLIENKFAEHIVLKYSTNGLLINDTHIELWKNFKGVELVLSVDDIGERYHFTRFPGNWKKLEEKLQFLKNNRKYLPEQSYIGIYVVVTFLNFLYLDKFIEYFSDNFPFIVINLSCIQFPEKLSPINLPASIKHKICDKLSAQIISLNMEKRLHSEVSAIRESISDQKILDMGIQEAGSFAEFHRLSLNETYPLLFTF